MKRGFVKYFLDFLYGATRYPFGGFKPRVVLGYFPLGDMGINQKLFYDELLLQGFKRTIWQLVFPGQTAGLIKKILPQSSGVNEYHVRFYDDGTIEYELEIDRFNSMHWIGSRQNDIEILEKFLLNSSILICEENKKEIKKLFGNKIYSRNCSREVIL